MTQINLLELEVEMLAPLPLGPLPVEEETFPLLMNWFDIL